MKIIEKIALAIFIPVFLLSVSAPLVFAQTATSIPSGIPFGGIVAVFVKPTLACPFAHSVIADFVTFQIIGVAVVPGSQVYQKNHQESAGSYILGTYIPAPLPCLLPYPVLPISQVGTS